MKFKVGDVLVYKTGSYRITILKANKDIYEIAVDEINFRDTKWSKDEVENNFRKLSKLEKVMK